MYKQNLIKKVFIIVVVLSFILINNHIGLKAQTTQEQQIADILKRITEIQTQIQKLRTEKSQTIVISSTISSAVVSDTTNEEEIFCYTWNNNLRRGG